ncbi:portal protein [uncultured Campylobacter sp.]|uniref:portal protein n=1 Tax=uncultured Campylobacter sp. TaxID=218934 RepID=UPI0026114FBA|nr:portal protein [uncultured Campylobacter sp.]
MKSLAYLKEIYKNDLNFNASALKEYKEAVSYYHANQLASNILSIILERGQSPVIENIYKMIINKILGYKAQSISEIRVSGRQKQDELLAHLLNDLLKVFSHSDFYNKEIMKRDRDLIFGLSVVELWVKEDEEQNRYIDFKSLDTTSFLIDKFSRDFNASDARRFHKKLNMDYFQAKEIFKDKEIQRLENSSGLSDTRAIIYETWLLEDGTWNRYFWQDNSILDYEISPLKTKEHPFVIAKYQIDDNNIWYGLFRDIKPMQDYINYAENKMGNMLGSFKALFESDAVDNADEFIESFGLDNSITKVKPGALRDGKLQVIQHHADIQALSQKANEKRQLAKILAGLNDEFLGVGNSRLSAEAIAHRRETGLMGLQDFLNRADDMDKLIFKKVLDLMQHYFTKEQVFKIVDEDRHIRYFEINTKEDNIIKIGRFDLEYKSQLKMQGSEERFMYWSEMMKVIANTQPDLIAGLLPLILKDSDSPVALEVQKLLDAKAKEAQELAQNSTQAKLQEMQIQLALEKEKAQIDETKAKAAKYTAQGLLAHDISQESKNQSMQKKGIDLR